MEIELIKADITTLAVDAIVNAANSGLRGGGGVDGAIHRAAGTGLLEECKRLNGCETGEAKITGGYNLPARYVIHTVGPVFNGGRNKEAAKLASCYRSCLTIAAEKKLDVIAFPGISTGVYGYPKLEAALIAVDEVRKFQPYEGFPGKIIFVAFDDETLTVYQKIIAGYEGK